MKRAASYLLVLAAAGTASAGDPPRRPDAAKAVVAAVRASDVSVLAALARSDEPDPWSVVDTLHVQLEPAAAVAFAGATTAAAGEGLLSYARGNATANPGGPARTAVEAARAAYGEGRLEDALEALDSGRAETVDVPSITLEHNRGFVLERLARRVEAERAYLDAAAGAERIGWGREAAKGYYLAAVSADDRSDYPAAVERGERSLALAERLGLRMAMEEAHTALGHAAETQGQLTLAIEHQRQVLRIAEEIDDDAGVIVALDDLGNLQMRTSDFAGARASKERALEIATRIDDLVATARILANLGDVSVQAGDHARAIEQHGRSLEIREQLGDRAGMAHVLQDLALAHEALGDVEQALDDLERAVQTARRQPDPATLAGALERLAAMRRNHGDPAAALEAAEEALATRRQIGDRAGAAATLGAVALLRSALGDRDRALADAVAALDEERALGVQAGVGRALAMLGAVRAARGETDLANATFAEAKAIGVTEDLAWAWGEAAAVHLARGDAAKASDAAWQGVQALAPYLAGYGDETGVDLLTRTSWVASTGAVAAAHTGDADRVFSFLEVGRAGALLHALTAHAWVAAARIPEALREDEARARAAHTRAAARLRDARAGGLRRGIEEAQTALDAAQAEVRRAVARTERKAALASDLLRPRPIDLATARSLLRPGDALVEFALPAAGAFALVVTADGARIVPLGPSGDVVTAAKALVPVGPAHDVTTEVNALRRLAVEPLGLAKEIRRVAVSPDGVLAYVPWSLVLPDVDVCLVPSATTWSVLAAGPAPVPGGSVLAVGDPATEGRTAPTRPSSRTGGTLLPRLEAAADEARAVGTHVLVGEQATESAVADLLRKEPRWRAVHFACHGLLDAERPVLSALALTPDARDDGFLTALEVFRTTVPADLVVLSACDTARGRIAEGEGVVGLSRAFLAAGATRVLSSLWDVNDEATRALMERFYALWNPRGPKDAAAPAPLGAAAALRRAQDEVRRDPRWTHPTFWAAWVLWGPTD